MDYKLKQKEFRDLAKPKFHPKGTPVMVLDKNGQTKYVANNLGHRRGVFKDRDFTKPNYKYRTERTEPEKFKGHAVNDSEGKRRQLMQAQQPRLANYVRHQISKANRAVRKGEISDVHKQIPPQ